MSSSKPPCYTIYCHTHVESGRRYIGLTSQTIMQRWKKHVYVAKFAKGGRWHFPNAIRKYGPEAFSHEVLEVCSTLEEANAAEVKWIEHFKTKDLEFGFNLKRGGDHTPHPVKNPWNRPGYREAHLPTSLKNVKKATVAAQFQGTQRKPEVRAALSEIMKKQATTPEGRAQRAAAAKPGKRLTAEHRAKISANDATKRPEVRAKLSEKSKAAWADPGFYARASAAQKGKKHSESHKAKIGAAARGRELSEEWKRSISEAMKLKPCKTHCKRGHPLEGENVRSSDPKRRCQLCRREHQRERRNVTSNQAGAGC